MCDYCDCRAQWPIEELGAEHAELTALAGRVRRHVADGEADDARLVFDRLLEVLDAHSLKEEAGVFSVLRSAGELVDDVTELVADHDAVALAAVELAEGAGPWAEIVEGVLRHLERHIHREEHDLYPATRVAVPADGWARIEEVHRRIGSLVATPG